METKTRIEIIDEIASFYNLGNRSVKLNRDGAQYMCLYNGPDGKHCAFARMCTDPTLLKEWSGTCDNILVMEGHGILKEEYRGHTNAFYVVIQSLHDKQVYWNETGLSELGKKHVEYLKQRWA